MAGRRNEGLTRRALLGQTIGEGMLRAEDLAGDQKEKNDAALPRAAPAKPKQKRRMLVTNLAMRDGKPWRGSSFATLPSGNYAIDQMGKRTGAYETVFDND